MLDAYIYDGLRTPIGRHAGKLAPVRPDDLAAEVLKEVVARNKIDPSEISDVVLGCVNQAGEDSRNVARFAALLSGLPPTTPGVTVNRLCASGLQAVVDAARAVSVGEGDMYLAGGVESMSRAPFVFSKSDSPYSRDVKMFDTTIGARFPNPRVVKQFGNHTMPETGDNVAKDFGITRQQADEFALASQQKYAKAEAEGFYKGEIHAVTVPSRKEPLKVDADEHPRRDSSMESLAKLKPLFEGGVVTAGNASGVNDGAAALVIASKQWGEKKGKKPIARILSAASAGVEPRIMGVGPAYAIPRALERAGLDLKKMDIIEINEAFASQVLGCLKLMNVDLK
ncbi:MAG TPA: acetyl-CoA C-acyltransferase, partial [Burkholderiales bacterium]